MIQGIEEIMTSLKAVSGIAGSVDVALDPIANKLVADIKQRVPVDEGDLQRSIKVYKTKKGRKTIGPEYGKGKNTGNHANLVEYGFTDRAGKVHPPRPFIRTAFESNKESILNSMEKAIGDIVVKAFEA